MSVIVLYENVIICNGAFGIHRRTLDRSIKEIRAMMEADKVYQKALSERNEVLQQEINVLRSEKVNPEIVPDPVPQQGTSASKKNKEGGDGIGQNKIISSKNKRVNASAKGKPNAVSACNNCRVKKSERQHWQQPPTRRTFIDDKRCRKCTQGLEDFDPKRISVAQRHAAAQRMSKALSNSPRRPVSSTVPSAVQDSTLYRPRHQAPTISHSVNLVGKKSKPSLLSTSGKRPLVALIRLPQQQKRSIRVAGA